MVNSKQAPPLQTNQETEETTMFNSLKKKPLAIALVTTGVVLGGLGTASAVSAQTADDEGTDSTVETDRSERDGERRGHRDGRGCGRSLETVAGVIGIEVDELQAALDDGQSLSDVAEANGVDPDAVVEALIADAEARLDENVEAGRLTEAEADEKLAEKTDRIEDRVAGVDSPERGAADEEDVIAS